MRTPIFTGKILLVPKLYCFYDFSNKRTGHRNMQNDKGEIVDLYIPRKCSITNRIISAKDHASVQINIGELDENGTLTGKNFTFASCGFVREMGEADDSFNKLCSDAKILNFNN